MELRQLQVLRELAALGSVTAVADSIGVTPSAVSQHLATLQRSFATPLTRKQGRTLALTDAGRVLADAASSVIEAMAAAHSAVQEFEHAPGGVVRVSGFHSAGQALFGPLVKELSTEAASPDLRLADEDVAQNDFPALTARYDLVLAHRMEYGPAWPAGSLQVITLAREPLDVALATSHPLARFSRLAPEDVVGERWATSRVGYSPDDVLRAIAAVANRATEVVHRINDYSAVAAVVATGSAIGILPRYTSTHVQEEGIVLRPLTGIGASRSIDLLARPESLRRRSVRLVAAAMRRVMTQLVEGDPPPNSRQDKAG